MKRTLLILLFLAAGCTSQIPGRSETVQRTCRMGKVSFETREKLVEDNQQRAKTQLWNAERLTQENESTPRFGYLTITTENNSIEMANPKHYELIIEKDGEIVHRQILRDKVPNYSRSSPVYWWAVDLVPMPVNPSGGFKVYLVQTIQNIRCEFEF